MLYPAVKLGVAVDVVDRRHVVGNQREDFLAGFLVNLLLAAPVVLE